MATKALQRKLIRELARLKGQIATVALVLAGGITCFIALRGTYLSLETARVAYYERLRFADVFARAERVPEPIARRIEALPSVALVETRVSKEVTVPMVGLPRAAYGRLLSLPSGRKPATNALYLRQGRLPEPTRDDEVVALESFAEAHHLAPGAELPVVISGRLRNLRVVGIALSPEFVFAIRPGALADDPKRYAVLWMDRGALGAAFGLDGAFNEVTVRIQPGGSEAATCAAIDRILAPFGGTGAVGRSGQLSHRILMQELSQLQALAGMVPVVFLCVAAFLINMVLGRLIRLQRPELATLKAIGYSNREVGLHYLALVVVVILPGNLLGVLGGWGLGRAVMVPYARAFRFPDLGFSLSPSLIVSALVASSVAATLGALGAVRSAVKLPPAEAMRPPAPARYRRGLSERLGLDAFLGPSGLMVLREIQRRPLRTLTSSLGIAGAVALLILGHFGWDSMTSYFEGTFRREQRQDLAVAFALPVTPRAVGELERMPGVLRAEGMRAVPVRISYEHRARDSILMGLPAVATLRRLVTRGGGAEVEVPEDGVLLTKTLGEILGLRIGDRPALEVREGDRRTIRPVIVGFIDESVGLQIYARASLVAALAGDQGAVSSVLLQVDPRETERIEAELRRSPSVIDVSDVRADLERLFDMNAATMDIWTAVSIVLASLVVFGVVYNNARIALSARSRDLASLRVLGFSRREISWVLLSGLAVEVVLALPLGLLLGRFWASRFMATVDQETFRWQVFIAPRTNALAVMVALLAAAASALWVRRSLDKLDLISVLKARE
ncbi:MAG TPA: ABC transporter permease [Polyangiaceae bacterium]|nr:ABC transporter permease [Polyangiaceae bacterium]